MQFLIAPDKFKGALTAAEAAENIALGLRHVLGDAQIDLAPVADGGEGTAEIVRRAAGGEWLSCVAHDALGRPISARYAWIEEQRTAIIEMSEAAGLSRLREGERDLLRATTFGVGEIIEAAANRGAREIIIALGGSATNDGGFGMARALGFRFYSSECELVNGPADLIQLTRIVQPDKIRLPKITGACDVRNQLLGNDGATRVFGPQKGATPEEVRLLERALKVLSETITRDLGCDFHECPGAGAAGGLGFGLMSFCGAELRAGFDLVASAINLEAKVRSADLVITGEGRLDAQTRDGKAPAGVAALAHKCGKPVYAIVGEVKDTAAVSDLFDGVFEVARPPISRSEAMRFAAQLLRERAAEFAREVVSRGGICRRKEY